LGQEAARARVDRFLETVQQDYAEYIGNASGAWTDNQLDFRFLASGLNISGNLVVAQARVDVSGSLPLAAALFRGQIERTIRGELERLLAS